MAMLLAMRLLALNRRIIKILPIAVAGGDAGDTLPNGTRETVIKVAAGHRESSAHKKGGDNK